MAGVAPDDSAFIKTLDWIPENGYFFTIFRYLAWKKDQLLVQMSWVRVKTPTRKPRTAPINEIPYIHEHRPVAAALCRSRKAWETKDHTCGDKAKSAARGLRTRSGAERTRGIVANTKDSIHYTEFPHGLESPGASSREPRL